MMNPRVSVLMSVFNGERFLADAVQSILRQTEPNFEFLIVDDGSTDGTAALLARFAAGDPRIRILRNAENLGLTRSLNRALDEARGPFVARQDADDTSAPERFRRQLAFLDSQPDCAAVGSAYRIIDVDGSELAVTVPPLKAADIARALRRRNVLAHGSLMLRSDALKAAGGYRAEFKSAQDYDLLLRLSSRAQIAALPEPLYSLRLVPGSISMANLGQQSRLAEQARTGSAVSTDSRHPPITGQDRYHQLKALHLLKSGRTREGRDALRRAGSCLWPVNTALYAFSVLPAPVRRGALSLKRWWETR